ncbi:MAG: hypothetical protein KBC42_01565 [Candidatus Pacebacteria bacterium]|nr:hypothetical protein [Candidatus Paceibacterota bacterium]MBP9780594.1 hypothetical protein [Candidatus Paceibacterota bacterium]
MFEEEPKIVEQIKTIHKLDEAGKLHHRVQILLAIMIVILVISGGIIVYDALFLKLKWFLPALFAVFFFFVGRMFAYRVNKIEKDDKRGVFILSRMDTGAIFIIVGFLIFRIEANDIFKLAPFRGIATATVLSFTSLAGIAAGRLVGLMDNIVEASHKKRRGRSRT